MRTTLLSATTLAVAALALTLTCAAPGHAITFLKPGVQTLEGVLVKEALRYPMAKPAGGFGITGGSCLEPPGQRRPAFRFGLLLSPGSKSEQFIPISAPVGNREFTKFLADTAVARWQAAPGYCRVLPAQ